MMFTLDESLMTLICSKINHDIVFLELDFNNNMGDCSCSGACGTYSPPCSCCAYN